MSATFWCSYLRYYSLYLSYQGLFRGRRAKRLMATGLCHGGWGAAIINYPRHQRSKPRPCLLLCGLRCGRGFVFTACLGVPWQGQQNFTIAMQSFSVTRYRFERQNVQYLRNGVLHLKIFFALGIRSWAHWWFIPQQNANRAASIALFDKSLKSICRYTTFKRLWQANVSPNTNTDITTAELSFDL